MDNSDTDSVVTLLPGALAWTEVSSLPRRLSSAGASIFKGRLRLTCPFPTTEVLFALCISIYILSMIFGWQVFEYHPAPWDQWVTVGNILGPKYHHAILTVGPQELPCLSAGHDKQA